MSAPAHWSLGAVVIEVLTCDSRVDTTAGVTARLTAAVFILDLSLCVCVVELALPWQLHCSHKMTTRYLYRVRAAAWRAVGCDISSMHDVIIWHMQANNRGADDAESKQQQLL